MMSAMPIGRRLILRRLVGGGAISWTLLGRASSANVTRETVPRPPPLVILDPGHGGHDPGATGAAGTLEKDVTLANALALKARLEGLGLCQVALTRGRDRYVPLDQRLELAQGIGAALMISLHADALSDTSVRGASVYTLSKQASDQETEALANRENGSVHGVPAAAVTPEVADILASLANRETRAASSRLSSEVVRGLGRDVPVLPTPERHANFAVLHSPDIPSVLVEMGFLSNPADEAVLIDPEHQDLIARSIARAVGAWFGQTTQSGFDAELTPKPAGAEPKDDEGDRRRGTAGRVRVRVADRSRPTRLPMWIGLR